MYLVVVPRCVVLLKCFYTIAVKREKKNGYEKLCRRMFLINIEMNSKNDASNM